MRQAQHAIDLGIRFGRSGQAICYEELGIYRLLLQIGDMHQLWQFEQLTSLDLINPDHRLSAHVAAKIIESQRSARHGSFKGP